MASKDILGGNRIERKKEETKRKIITVAMDLFKKQGFDATTMEQIAEEVDIAKATLYNYFSVKEAILSGFIQCSFQQRNEERIAKLKKLPDTRARLTLILTELINGIQTEKEIFERFLVYRVQNMLSLRRDPDAESGIGCLGMEMVKLGQQNSELREDLPIDYLRALFEFVFIIVAQQFYRDPVHFQAGKAIAQGVDLFMNGAQASKSKP